jgi:hypothetical protein
MCQQPDEIRALGSNGFGWEWPTLMAVAWLAEIHLWAVANHPATNPESGMRDALSHPRDEALSWLNADGVAFDILYSQVHHPGREFGLAGQRPPTKRAAPTLNE